MRTAAATPYLVPPGTVIEPDQWSFATGGPLPERLEHWDPFTDIDITRIVTVDADQVRSACQLSDDAQLAIAVSWYSTSTRITGGPPATELGNLQGRLRVRLALNIPGSRIGARTDLRTRLILRHGGPATNPIAPAIPGTILWMDQTSVLVEGSAARFPVTAVDFGPLRYPTGAGWVLDWDQDLSRPVLGTMRLLVNTAHPSLVEALGPNSADPRSAAIASFITFDVARSMVRAALRDDDFVRAPHAYDEGTVGRAVKDLIELCWPAVAIATLAVWSLENPARLDAQLQDHLGTLI